MTSTALWRYTPPVMTLCGLAAVTHPMSQAMHGMTLMRWPLLAGVLTRTMGATVATAGSSPLDVSLNPYA